MYKHVNLEPLKNQLDQHREICGDHVEAGPVECYVFLRNELRMAATETLLVASGCERTGKSNECLFKHATLDTRATSESPTYAETRR